MCEIIFSPSGDLHLVELRALLLAAGPNVFITESPPFGRFAAPSRAHRETQ